MISTSWYHEIRYWAQTISLKHHQIRDTAQTIFLKHRRIRDGTQNILLKQGYGFVHPSDNVFSHYAPLRFVGKRRADETRCFRIMCSIQETSTILSLTWMYAQAINQIRQLLTTWLKEQYLWRDVWLFSRTGQQHCFRGVKNGIRGVACA